MRAVFLKKAERLREKLTLVEQLASVPQEIFVAERPRRDLCAFYLPGAKNEEQRLLAVVPPWLG